MCECGYDPNKHPEMLSLVLFVDDEGNLALHTNVAEDFPGYLAENHSAREIMAILRNGQERIDLLAHGLQAAGLHALLKGVEEGKIEMEVVRLDLEDPRKN